MEMICKNCHKVFNIPPSRKSKRLNCSKNCYVLCQKGKKLSDEHKEKISIGVKNSNAMKTAFKKGSEPWNKDIKYDEKMKARLNISGLWTHGEGKGRKHTIETKKRISEAKMGCSGYWKGKKRLGMNREKHWNWKGGISSLDKLDRHIFAQTIRKQVLKRDNFTCQMCNQRGVDLQVDHIQPWSEYVELRFDINNCRTLCINCHYKITFGRELPNNVLTWGHNITQKGG